MSFGLCTRFDDPDWKYEPVIVSPDEWTDEHEALHDCRVEMLAERLYVRLCQFSNMRSLWRPSFEESFEHLLVAAVDADTQKILCNKWQYSDDSEEYLRLWNLQEDAELAMYRLIDEGRIEWRTWNGCPWLYVPEAEWVLGVVGGDANAWAKYEASKQSLRTMPYREYLRTEWWRKRRHDMLVNAGHRCQLCNRVSARGRSLQVHHRTYDRRGDERDADLVVLCSDCHQHFHDKLRVSR